MVVAELKDKLLQQDALGYRSIKVRHRLSLTFHCLFTAFLCPIQGYPKPIPCLRADRIETFLEMLPSHYMVSEAAVVQFRGSIGQPAVTPSLAHRSLHPSPRRCALIASRPPPLHGHHTAEALQRGSLQPTEPPPLHATRRRGRWSVPVAAKTARRCRPRGRGGAASGGERVRAAGGCCG